MNLTEYRSFRIHAPRRGEWVVQQEDVFGIPRTALKAKRLVEAFVWIGGHYEAVKWTTPLTGYVLVGRLAE